MLTRKGLAAGVIILLGTAVLVAAAAATPTAGQSGTYPPRPPGSPGWNEQRFEIQAAPWGGTTTARRLGVTLEELTAAEASKRKLPTHSGLLVETVEATGPAAKAGIKVGDVILKVNGEIVRSIVQLRRLVNESPDAQNAVVTIFRDGKVRDVFVKPEAAALRLDLLPDDFQQRLDELSRKLPGQLDLFRRSQPRWFQGQEPPDLTPGAPFNRPRWPLFRWSPGAERLGVVVQDIGPQLADYFKVKSGVLVASVTALSPAEAAGLRAGDVITAVNGKEVAAAADLLDVLRGMKDGEEVTLKIVRASNPMTIKVKLGGGRKTWHVQGGPSGPPVKAGL